MKDTLKSFAARLAASRPIRSAIVHLVYPTVIRALKAEFRADVSSPSGIAEEIAWKTHAYEILHTELAPGLNCCPDRMESTSATRTCIFERIVNKLAGISGDIFEFGVSSGTSFLWFLKRCPDRQVYGFDSFEGLPEDWWTRSKGSFASEPPQFSEPNGTLIKGWFEDSLPGFFQRYYNPIALIHVDCDLFKPAIYSMSHTIPLCKPGCIVLFDEYYNYPGFARHEWLAWRQIQLTYQIHAECIAYDSRRAAFQINQIVGPPTPVGSTAPFRHP